MCFFLKPDLEFLVTDLHQPLGPLMFHLDAEGDSSLNPVLTFSMTSSLKTNHFLLAVGIQVSRSHSQVPNPRDLQNCSGSMGMAKETGAKIPCPYLPEALGLPVKF